VYLIDTNVISEARKGTRAHAGVQVFFVQAAEQQTPLYLSAITVGELRRGIELIRHRGDSAQAKLLERWLSRVLKDFAHHVLPFEADTAQVWGRLRVPNPENEIDKQIAATAWLHGLTLVTSNVSDFSATGVRVLNPFAPPAQ
jgi:toxin FitB